MEGKISCNGTTYRVGEIQNEMGNGGVEWKKESEERREVASNGEKRNKNEFVKINDG